MMKIIRMQGATKSKYMLPCGRRVHLHKPISFQTIFEQIPQNHKIDAKKKYQNGRKIMLENIQKMIRKNIETN